MAYFSPRPRNLTASLTLLRNKFIWVALAAALDVALFTANRAEPLPESAQADHVTVDKARRVLSLYSGDTLLKTYRVALGPDSIGHKEQQGDGRTPEGE